MKHILWTGAAVAVALFASTVYAEETASDATPDGAVVQIVSGSTVIAWAKVPGNATITMRSDRTQAAQPAASSGGPATMTATGNATLVATVGGQEIMTLHGDQLIVTKIAAR